MDRRRFIPTPLGSGLVLETRQLLSTTTSIFGQSTSAATTASNLPVNLAQRLTRIDHLPYIMVSYQPNRTLPTSVIRPIQDDLTAIISTIHDPPPRSTSSSTGRSGASRRTRRSARWRPSR